MSINVMVFMPEAVPKIEGHAAFYTHLKNGRVDEARIIGLENDRFVEKILVGRKYWEAPIITSRICGICPTIHNVTSTKAIESACGVTPSAQTKTLRELMLAGQMIQSHSLHLYLLVLPDYVGVSSSFELQKNHPELFKNAIILKKYADKILEIVGGRAVHPIASVPGGFKSYPIKSELRELLLLSSETEKTAEETISLFSDFQYPEIKHEVISSALHDHKNYAFYEWDIWTSQGDHFEAQDYSKYIYEELKPYTRAKFGTLKGEVMHVGAMARMNLNKFPNQRTAKIAKKYELRLPFDNAFDNIIAQALENYYFVIRSIDILKDLTKNGLKNEHIKPPKSFGIGTSACEAPRGTLFHHYELNDEGDIIKCDIITPTVQNLTALEQDIKTVTSLYKTKNVSERNKTIEMLIRAYDPCITCATH